MTNEGTSKVCSTYCDLSLARLETGLLSNQKEKSINFHFIKVPLRKKVLKYGTPNPRKVACEPRDGSRVQSAGPTPCTISATPIPTPTQTSAKPRRSWRNAPRAFVVADQPPPMAEVHRLASRRMVIYSRNHLLNNVTRGPSLI